MSKGEERNKDTEFYAATVTAWFETKLELDKSLITLATGGIGVLVTLVSTVGVRSAESLVLYISAIISFVFCVGTVLWIFRRNATHLQAVIKEQVANDPLLERLDFVSIIAFSLGVLFSSIIGISEAVSSFAKEKIVAEKNPQQVLGRTSVKDSFNGAAAMKPDTSADVAKSFSGAAALKPNAPQSPSVQTPAGSAPVQTQVPTQSQASEKK